MIDLPSLPLDDWRATRDTVHGYSQVLGAIRAALSARQKHSSHRSLRVAAAGLTTGPIPAGTLVVEMLLDLSTHRLLITTNHGQSSQQPLHGQSAATFLDESLGALAALGVKPTLDPAPFASTAPGAYEAAAVERFWRALSQIDTVLERFKGELHSETSPVQLWPHGFDLAMLWFSGRLVPGADPNVPRNADEQMNFGFSTGDASLPEPYFYATAYPLPPALPSAPLPAGVTWHNKGWQGAVLRYGDVVDEERLLNYWRSMQRAGAKLMR